VRMNEKQTILTGNKGSDMMFHENRLKTFKKWPFDKNTNCTAEKMADAGFYVVSASYPDSVMCAFCQLEMDGWEPNDDPWTEHSRKNRQIECAFLKLRKPEDQWTLIEFMRVAAARHAVLSRTAGKKFITELETKSAKTEQEILTAKRKQR